MARTLSICGWEQFQHYKDRDPPWIKLHRSILSSEPWVMGSDQQRLTMFTVMLLAARHDNVIPANSQYIQKAAHLDAPPDLDWLVQIGFCEYAEQVATQTELSTTQAPRQKWNTRYVSAQTRSAVLKRDGGKCLLCGVRADLEIDHIRPISQGGDGDINNLQTLCRSCNRAKRVRTNDARQVLRTQEVLRSPEEIREEAEQSRAEQSRSMSAAPTDVVPRGTKPVDPEIQEVFDHWRQAHHHPKAALDRKRRKVIGAALGDYSAADLCRSISGYLNSPHHMGRNDAGTVYDAIELMLRDASHIDAGLKFYEQPPAEPESDFDRMARANGTAREDHHGRIYEHPSAEPVAFAAGAIRG